METVGQKDFVCTYTVPLFGVQYKGCICTYIAFYIDRACAVLYDKLWMKYQRLLNQLSVESMKFTDAVHFYSCYCSSHY